MDVDAIFAKLSEAGEDWADKDAAATVLEETRKSVLSDLMLNSAQTSIAGKEMEALADPSYRDYLAKMCNARKSANKAKVKYDSIKAWIELTRSAEATRRAEASIR